MVKPLLMVPLENLLHGDRAICRYKLYSVSGALHELSHVAAAEFCAHRLCSRGRPCADTLDTPAQLHGGQRLHHRTWEQAYAQTPAPTTVNHADEEDAPHCRWPAETKLKVRTCHGLRRSQMTELVHKDRMMFKPIKGYGSFIDSHLYLGTPETRGSLLWCPALEKYVGDQLHVDSLAAKERRKGQSSAGVKK